MHFRKAVSAAETLRKGHTASDAWGCHALGTGSGRAECYMGSIDMGTGMVGRATTAVVASRHSQCSQAPPRGGSRDFVPAF